ncbi:MAG TPA: hypothetical protein VEZ90_18235, partial [Blastocatellia bacterium]|nr:hypothetical protein [Blastocatellia bacterium]
DASKSGNLIGCGLLKRSTDWTKSGNARSRRFRATKLFERCATIGDVMTTTLKDTMPHFDDLPPAFRREGAISLEMEQGAVILRASKAVQRRLASLVRKSQIGKLTNAEKEELEQFEPMDDYLSLLNRLSRNLVESQKAGDLKAQAFHLDNSRVKEPDRV